MVALPRHLGRRVALRQPLREIRGNVSQVDEEGPAAAALLRLQQILSCQVRGAVRPSLHRPADPGAPRGRRDHGGALAPHHGDLPRRRIAGGAGAIGARPPRVARRRLYSGRAQHAAPHPDVSRLFRPLDGRDPALRLRLRSPPTLPAELRLRPPALPRRPAVAPPPPAPRPPGAPPAAPPT